MCKPDRSDMGTAGRLMRSKVEAEEDGIQRKMKQTQQRNQHGTLLSAVTAVNEVS